MAEIRERNNWLLGVNGIIAIIFGLIALFLPGAVVASLVFAFGIFAVIYGIIHIFGSVIHSRYSNMWGVRLFEGIVEVAVGLAILSFPTPTIGLFMLAVGTWALVVGILSLINVFRFEERRGMNLLYAIVSIVFAGLIYTNPLAATLSVAYIIGVYAILLGIMQIADAATYPEEAMLETERKEGKTIDIHRKAA